MNPYRKHAYLLLLIVSVIWGVAGVVIKYTLGEFPPLLFLTYRFGISSIVALISFITFGIRFPKDKKLLLITLFYAFLVSTVSLGLLFLGTEQTTALDAILISATAPIMLAAAGALFLKEHVTLREKIGISIAFAGTLVTIVEPVIRNGAGWAGLGGNLLIFASVLVATVTAVMAKILLRKDVEPFFVTNVSFVVGFLTLIPFVFIFYSSSEISQIVSNAPPSYHMGVVYMALISGTLAYTLWHKAQKSIEVGEAGLFTYLTPVFGAPLAVIWLGESLSLPFIIGAVVIGLGVAIAEYKKPQKAA